MFLKGSDIFGRTRGNWFSKAKVRNQNIIVGERGEIKLVLFGTGIDRIYFFITVSYVSFITFYFKLGENMIFFVTFYCNLQYYKQIVLKRTI